MRVGSGGEPEHRSEVRAQLTAAAQGLRSDLFLAGQKNPRIEDFRQYLCGRDDLHDGLLGDLLAPANKESLSLETCRKYTIWLGFSYQDLQKGTFSDKHEDPINVSDRNDRFLPEYLRHWKSGPCTFRHGEQLLDVDILSNESMDLREHFYDIKGGDGKTRRVDLGGLLPEGDGRVHIVATHDESCFKSGEFETKAWVEGTRQVCKDKGQGSSIHLACFGVEYGNGTICMDPDDPSPPFPIHLDELRKWHKAKHDPGAQTAPLPKTADVWMRPGSGASKEGWWKSPEFWMQVELAQDIFASTFSSNFLLVPVFDWSQGKPKINHLYLLLFLHYLG